MPMGLQTRPYKRLPIMIVKMHQDSPRSISGESLTTFAHTPRLDCIFRAAELVVYSACSAS